MKERERILDLVKKGVLSTEEALDLLENSAQKETRKSVDKDYSEAEYNEEKQSSKQTESNEDPDETTESEEVDAEEKRTRARLEEEMERLSNEASAFSVEVDRLTLQWTDKKKELHTEEQSLIRLQNMEDLDDLSEDKAAEITAMEEKIETLQSEVDDLQEEKQKAVRDLQSVKRKQWTTQAKKFSEKLDIPEEWKESASEAFSQVGKSVSRVGSEVSKTLKETFDSVSDNFDWTEMNVKVPSLASTKFTHEFVYPNSTATILDFKLANGNVSFKTSKSEDIKIDAQIKIYGKLDGQSSMEAFNERSSILETEDQLKFHVPNKRIRCHLVVSLPEKDYDYTAIHLLNGNVTIEDYKGKDLYVKNTNGNLKLQNVEAVMLETKGTNGTVSVKDSIIRDVLINTINGDIVVRGDFDNSGLSTVNGSVRATLTEKTSTRLDATSVNGMIKIALPASLDVEGEAHTNFGKIYSRFSDEELLSEKKERTNRFRRFRRVREDHPMKLTATTTAGNILMKDSE